MAIVSVGTERLAKMFGITQRHVQNLTKDEILHATKTTKGYIYNLDDAVWSYIQYIKAQGVGEKDRKSLNELQQDKLKIEIALKTSQTELHNLRTDIAKGKYLLLDDVQNEYTVFITVIKKFLNALPNRVAGFINGMVDNSIVRKLEKDIQLEIDKHINGFLLEVKPIEDLEE